MRKKLFVIFFLITHLMLLAKKNHENSSTGLEFFYQRIVPIQLNIDKNIPQNLSQEDLLKYISKEIANLNEGESVEILAQLKNAHSSHILLQQTFKSKPVYGAKLKINYLNNGKVLSISNGFFDIPQSIKNQANTTFDQNIVLDNWLKDKSFDKKQLEIDQNWLFLDGVLEPILKVIVDIPSEVYYTEWLLDSKGQTIATKDLNRYQTTATARVFQPDPLTSAMVDYGIPYIDSLDTDRTALGNELKTVDIDVNFSAGSYTLESPIVIIQDLSAPNIAPPVSAFPSFMYSRGRDEFEAVNAYYHIQTFANHIISLGYPSLLNDQIMVDGNGLNGQDQSIFTPSNPPRINFGEGGVDDAEDADVVVHEYGHYISHATAPGTNEGFERLGLDEGLCDFFAAAYSKNISSFRWYDIFTWDGHNEFWSGRSANTSKKYPDDVNSQSIHSNGEILSSAMMEVHNLLGRSTSEKLMIQAMYSFASNMSMSDAGNLVLQADSTLFDGAHYCEIFAVLNRYGICSSDLLNLCLRKDENVALPVLSNYAICPGDSVLLIEPESLNPDFYYSWSPNYNLDDYTSTPFAFPDTTTTYQLNVQTPDGRYNMTEVEVKVEKCSLEINNSEAFSDATGNLIVNLPERFSLRPKWIRLIDINGRVVQYWDIDTDVETWNLESNGLTTGVYILQMRRNNGKYLSEKLLKLK